MTSDCATVLGIPIQLFRQLVEIFSMLRLVAVTFALTLPYQQELRQKKHERVLCYICFQSKPPTNSAGMLLNGK